MNFDAKLKSALSRKKADIITEEDLFNVLIVENNEPLVDISDFVDVEINMRSIRRDYAGENKLYARQKVCEMLKQVDSDLPTGYKLVIFDAFRPIEYQQMRFDSTLERIMLENPDLSLEDARKETFIYVFPPSWDLKTPPPHSTGGAVDLTLRTTQGSLLDVGNTYGQFDETTYTNNDIITPQQALNRKFLLETMLKAGFLNYPGEWWHFMYGDREWAAYEGKANAIYTGVSLDKK